MPKKSKVDHRAQPSEKIFWGYQTAVDLMIYATEQSWERFNIMIAVNALIVAAIGFSPPRPNEITLASPALAIVGLFLSVAWLLLVKRTHEFSDYYTLAAREIEERYLIPEITTLSHGGDLSEGKKIKLKLLGGVTDLQLSQLARLSKAKFISYFVIVVFAAFYISMLFLTISNFLPAKS